MSALSVRLRAYLSGFAQAVNHVAYDTEGTCAVEEPREDQAHGWNDGLKAIETARQQEAARLAVEISSETPRLRGISKLTRYVDDELWFPDRGGSK